MRDLRKVDVLSEVINIGIGQAAAALSDIVGDAVTLTVPEIRVLRVDEMGPFVEREIADWGVFIAQAFEGEVTGRAVLVYSEDCAGDLLAALLPGEPRTATLTEAGRTTLQEVGNIILASCISVFGDLLESRLAFTIPRVRLESSGDFFRRVLAEFTPEGVAIAVKSEMALSERQIRGMLIVLLTFADFDLVARRAEERWTP